MSKRQLAQAFVAKYYSASPAQSAEDKCSGSCDHSTESKCGGSCSGSCKQHT